MEPFETNFTLGDNSSPEIATPKNLIEDGYREIVSIWRKKEPDGERLIAIARPTYDYVDQWTAPLEICARAVSRMIAQAVDDPNNKQIPVMAALLLTGAAKSIAASSGIKLPLAGLEAPAPTLPSPEQQIDIPEEVLLHKGSQEVMTVWRLPTEPEETDDGQHLDDAFVCVATDGMSAYEIGTILANLAAFHVNYTQKTHRDKLITMANIQKTFHDKLTEGLPRA